jgi:hypothetical protein
MGFIRERPHFFPSILASLMLFIGTALLPYGYYQILRWIVCSMAIFNAYIAYRFEKALYIVIFGIIAILFNPIFIISFQKDVWQTVDIICGIVFVASILLLRKSTNFDIMPSANTNCDSKEHVKMVYCGLSEYSWKIVKIITLVIICISFIFGLWVGIQTGNYQFMLLGTFCSALGVIWALPASVAIIANTLIKPSKWTRMTSGDWVASVWMLIVGSLIIYLAINYLLMNTLPSIK